MVIGVSIHAGPVSSIADSVARSRQVCIYWLWKHCLIAIYLGNELGLIDIRKPFRSRTCLVRIADPCPAVPAQLVPARLGLSPAGSYQLWCTNLRIATDTRPSRNMRDEEEQETDT